MIAQARRGLSAPTLSGTLVAVLQGREPTFGDGRYIIRRELGRGTMGVVYEAEDAVLARTVAVKTIDLTFAAGEAAGSEFEQRFFTEARVAARLSHPGIVVCHDVGKDAASGKLFIVFEYLKGRTLADRAAEGPMDWRGALEVVVQVARAIHHAHAARRRPPRPQAGEHHAPRSGHERSLGRARRGGRQDHGLRGGPSRIARTAAHPDGAVLRLAALHVAGAGAGSAPAAPARTSSRWARSCARCSWAGPGSMRRASPRS